MFLGTLIGMIELYVYCQLWFHLPFTYRFRCNVCDKKLRCDHMGKREIIKHAESKSHRDQAESIKTQRVYVFVEVILPVRLETTEAELKMAVLTAAYNIPLAFHDKLSPTIRACFSDSKIAQNYHSASTKATCMLNLAFAPSLIDTLLSNMISHPFSVCVDGSNDTGLEK